MLMRIRLELARDQDFPNGSKLHGYDFAAPLNADGHLDLAEWKTTRERCRVKRFWAGEPDLIGHLVHKSGGQSGRWVFDYNAKDDSDDEPGFKFDKHTFAAGEYVSVQEHDGQQRTFRVASVRDLAVT
ncbi:MAG: hypothetical protein HOO99_16910 [Hyphomicrobiaceae bacterium]|nr:hypothetical protein [Hyphomicrobiaceae bacterium]